MSMVYWGLAHKKGTRTKKDFVSAEEWYRRAAEAGSVPAHYALGGLYLDTKRYKEARDALRYSAERNHAPSLSSLGRMYALAVGSRRDICKAPELLERSSALANRHAKGLLGIVLFFLGPTRWRGAQLFAAAIKELIRDHNIEKAKRFFCRAEALDRQGHHSKAEPMNREVVTIYEANRGPEHLENRGTTRLSRRQLCQAETVFRSRTTLAPRGCNFRQGIWSGASQDCDSTL